MAGPPTYGGRRRVAGLRREEVALPAGVSVDYYTAGTRESQRGLRGCAGFAGSCAAARRGRASHLFDLARAANTTTFPVLIALGGCEPQVKGHVDFV